MKHLTWLCPTATNSTYQRILSSLTYLLYLVCLIHRRKKKFFCDGIMCQTISWLSSNDFLETLLVAWPRKDDKTPGSHYAWPRNRLGAKSLLCSLIYSLYNRLSVFTPSIEISGIYVSLSFCTTVICISSIVLWCCRK